MMFYEEKGLAMCGLACALCSQKACPGCLKEGCEGRENCKIYHCASAKGLAGCYACDQFPCEESMFQSVRVQAFNHYAKAFGVQALMERLKENAENGVVYHQPDSLKGDYDGFSTEDEIMQFIQFGRNNPYKTCPTFETEHFLLRLVAEADAEDLLACYADPHARRLFNTDNCPPGAFDYVNRMPEMIRGWLAVDYAGGYFIRFSIIDQMKRKAVGTVEIYDRKYQQSDRTTGILRIDLAPAYETKTLLMELLDVSTEIFFDIFHAERILHQAFPEAVERIAALRAKGFVPVDIEGGKHYFVYCAAGLDPYTTCPVLESEHFSLRLVAEADVEDLLGCYSDPEAQRFFNADNCTSDFKYKSVNEMAACIQSWLQCYQSRAFVRWSIVDKSTEHAVGTVEMFGSPEKWGILRVDVGSQYETQPLLNELFELAGKHFFSLFQVERMLVKAIPAAVERIAALEAAGFVPAKVAGREHYFMLGMDYPAG